MHFDAFLEGRLPQGLINGLGQIQARINDPGPRLSACGLSWAAWAWGRVLVRLAMKNTPGGFLGPDRAILSPLAGMAVRWPGLEASQH